MVNFSRLIRFLATSSRHIPRARWAVAAVLVTATVSGVASTVLIALINSVISGASVPMSPALAFVGLCALFPLSRFLSDTLLNYIAESSLYRLRVELSRRILAAPFRQVEALGVHRLLATLTTDVAFITAALVEIPLLCRHIAVVVGCLVLMCWLSWSVFLVILALTLIGMASYRVPVMKSQSYFAESREMGDRLYKSFQGLTQGVKELMMSHSRSRDFITKLLEPRAAAMRNLNIRGAVVFAAGNGWGQVLFFVGIGYTIFIAPQFVDIERSAMSGFTLAIIFMLTPLDSIMNVMPRLSRASVAVNKIECLGLSLDADKSFFERMISPNPVWHTLELAGVSYSYQRDKGSRFVLGPLDLLFRPGELVFIIGGNGSGKTTLAKLLLGLYSPESGEVRLNGEAIDEDSIVEYRQLFSAVFSDAFLFDELIGVEKKDFDRQAMRYLERLRISHKVKVEKGKLSTIDLSQGQRKRLALLAAYLEDRPIFLFDEWAAEQDPEFREVFYRSLLPELRSRKKTVFVITHDDRYFDVADRIIKLDYGRISNAHDLETAEVS